MYLYINKKSIMEQKEYIGMERFVILTENQIEKIVNDAVERCFDRLSENLIKKEEDNCISINEVSKKYSLSRTTLWRWEKLGYLRPKRLGRKIFYSEEEIQDCLNSKV